MSFKFCDNKCNPENIICTNSPIFNIPTCLLFFHSSFAIRNSCLEKKKKRIAVWLLSSIVEDSTLNKCNYKLQLHKQAPHKL